MTIVIQAMKDFQRYFTQEMPQKKATTSFEEETGSCRHTSEMRIMSFFFFTD